MNALFFQSDTSVCSVILAGLTRFFLHVPPLRKPDTASKKTLSDGTRRTLDRPARHPQVSGHIPTPLSIRIPFAYSLTATLNTLPDLISTH